MHNSMVRLLLLGAIHYCIHVLYIHPLSPICMLMGYSKWYLHVCPVYGRCYQYSVTFSQNCPYAVQQWQGCITRADIYRRYNKLLQNKGCGVGGLEACSPPPPPEKFFFHLILIVSFNCHSAKNRGGTWLLCLSSQPGYSLDWTGVWISMLLFQSTTAFLLNSYRIDNSPWTYYLTIDFVPSMPMHNTVY